MAVDKSDVVTSQHIATLRDGLSKAEGPMKTLEVKAKQNEYFKERYEKYNTLQESLKEKVDAMEKDDIGKQPRKKFTAVNTVLTTFLKELVADVKKKESTTYFFGKGKKVGSAGALEKKVKDALPEDAKKHASQAVNSVVKNDTSVKDASKAGTDVKHASAGKKGTDASCTVFFTREEKNSGLDTEVTVIGVGSHDGASSYTIHWSDTTKLKVGKSFSL